jgi:hypothetical protein
VSIKDAARSRLQGCLHFRRRGEASNRTELAWNRRRFACSDFPFRRSQRRLETYSQLRSKLCTRTYTNVKLTVQLASQLACGCRIISLRSFHFALRVFVIICGQTLCSQPDNELYNITWKESCSLLIGSRRPCGEPCGELRSELSS